MALSQVFRCALGGFSIRIERSLVLLKEFLFDCDVVVSDAQHDHAVFGLSLLGESTLVFISFDFRLSYLRYELILDQN